MKVLIAPSILSADFGNLNQDMASVEKHVDLFHIDVMDGHFVPNITIGIPVVAALRTSLPLDLHLMIENPEKYVEEFAKALDKTGCPKAASNITVHYEACVKNGSESGVRKLIGMIKTLGVKAGVSINPGTDVKVLEPFLDEMDLVLLMSVNPGFGGQKFIENVIPKIKWLREKKSNLDIEIDGGINAETGKLCREAGANLLVAGSYIFGSKDRVQAIASLR